nr:receptor-like protein kinase ANXUR2 [Tanacetum cinerariifolium]
MTRRLIRKSDVYSFGVVQLEILCGRPAVDPSLGEEELGLVGWAQQNIIEGTINDIIDLNMTGLTPCSRKKIQIVPDCLKAFVKIADRPTMSEVVVDLEAALALQERGEYLVCSRYNNGSSSTPIYSSGSSTPPRYSPEASTPQSYSMGTSKNAECSNCKHLLDKITVLEATVDMYMHLE